MTREHGHGLAEIRARLSAPKSKGYLRDAVYGGIDGAVTTFAIVAGIAGAGLPVRVVLALGVASILADGFSMAAGNYSATKTELDDLARLRAVEERHIAEHPEGELLELQEILRAKGLSGDTLAEATAKISESREAWIELMLAEEYGLSPVIPNPIRAALATFAAFLAAGLVPLIPFLLGTGAPFAMSLAATLAVFFAIGTVKSHWSLAHWWQSGFETLAIGGAAAIIAYGAGSLFRV